MTALTWDDTGKRQYEMGTDHGVLYPMTDGGVYENGVSRESIVERPYRGEIAMLPKCIADRHFVSKKTSIMTRSYFIIERNYYDSTYLG